MFVEVFDFIGFIRKNLFFFRLRHFWVLFRLANSLLMMKFRTVKRFFFV